MVDLLTLDYPLHIIGLGVTDTAHLAVDAQAALNEAEWVVGSARQLAAVSGSLNTQQTFLLPKLSKLADCLLQHKGARVVVLASGDPLFYGIGRWFLNHFEAEKLIFHPGVSSIQTACHRLGLAMQDVEVLSLHGRPLQRLRAVLRANRDYVVLTDLQSTPQLIAQQCMDSGFVESQIVVCESLGYPQEQVRQFSCKALQTSEIEFDPLNVVVVHTFGSASVLPEFPGIKNENFITDGLAGEGLLSKREVRLAILSLLQPQAGDVAWDVGAGCGGVSVEWARWNPQGQVIAIEQHPQRFACLQANIEKFGLDANTQLINDFAPQALLDLPSPTAVFIGGSKGHLAELLAYCWQRLPRGGRLVASAVTEDSKTQLHKFADECVDAHIESLQIAVSRGETLAGQRLYRPQLPVTLVKYTKGSAS